MAAHDGASTSGSSSSYDVFLSFRGEDTCNNFIGFLHSALKREGINVFIDSEGLWGGEEIQTALLDAIQQSKISIPVFSKGYADSKWCLMELVEIIRCHRSNDQKVLPIFLDVEPRDVRHQTGSFEGSFQKHMERYDAQKMQSWKDALIEVAKKKGFELKDAKGNQPALVKLIVDWALSELSSNRLSDVKHPVGLNARVEDVLSRLKVHLNDVRFVGICGIGGMGKTTIAKTLYNRIFKKFDMSCFLANVKEEALSGPNGEVSLQEKLIYSVSKQEEKIFIVDGGKQLIKEKLQGKKVLLILDDVDSYSQLKDSAIDSILFGPGSRIIITTRDEHILNVAKVDGDNIYQPKELDDKESLQVFSLHAFLSDRPPDEYLQLSRDVIQLAGGLPLTLEVLGSSLFGVTEKDVWQSMSQDLKSIPHGDVYKQLRISYDMLNDNEKSIFLDAACFFVGKSRKYVISSWDACGFNPKAALDKLTKRCLLKFETVDYYCKKKYDVLRMHEQIQAMGRRIVYEENPTEPSKRSRLWSHEELFEAIEEPEGVKMLEVIHMPLVCNQPFEYSRDFPKMSKLRLLHLGEPPLRGDYLDFQNLPLNLRWLTWKDLIVRDNFHHEKLVHMDLSRSWIGKVWTNKPQNENKRFQKLKVLILHDCDVSRESLDFSWFPYLETLDLSNCTNMVTLHKSIGDLKSLVKLNFRFTGIEELPNSIFSLSSLKNLYLGGCYKLKNLPDSIGDLKSLVKLDLEETNIEEIPSSIYKLTCLKVLNLKQCSSLKNLPDTIGDLKSLVKLNLEGTKIEEIPSSICKLSCLEVLNLNRCSSLKNLPDSTENLKSLVKLDLAWTKIEEIPSSICKSSNLIDLNLGGCSSLKSLPYSIGDLKSLVKLHLEETKIQEIPNSICKLSCLEYLNLSRCSSLKNLPESIWDLESLNELRVIKCKSLTDTPKWKIHGQGTLLVDEMSRGINNYSLLNVNDGIDKGLILCVVFDLRDHVEERQLVDISLLIHVSIRRKHRWIRCGDEMVIEGVQYTARKRDIIYIHHFKGFDWFGIPLKPGIDVIEDIQVFWNIKTSYGNLMPFDCKAKFWKVLLESTTSEQQQQITNQEEEESITTTARRMVADFFNWSDDEDHGRSHHFVPIQQEGRSTHKKIHHFTSSSSALEIEGSNKWAHDGASSSSSFGSTHDVFLSFRGEDTIFTGFLHSALKREGINVFIDSEGLWGGEEIQTALLDAIQQSKISIPVFSKGYADSKWRLMELVEINRCHGSNGQKVLPIFLDVEPRDVRHQKGSFEGSFQTHMKEYDAQRIQSWRDALTALAGKNGYELKQVNGNQSELVKLVVDWALSELSSNCLSDLKNPVGLDARVEDVLSRLMVDSNDIQSVGICGISGMGKTTIATALYNRIFKNFEMSCFLANVKEEASSGPNGVVSLQEKLIYSVSKQEEKICIVDGGKQLIKEKLQGKKVLLILDDVDSYSQLKDSAIDSILFGPGSRIIITTRDEHILNVAKVNGDNIYQPKELDDKESLQLFSLHAFLSDRPPDEYLQLSRDVIQLAGGLPLTLEVLGSSLFGVTEKDVWQSMSQDLKRIPHDDVYKKLRISYDKLNDNEKSIFLDAACFFVGWRKETLISIWDACGFNTILAIKKLTQRSLLQFTPNLFSSYDELRMHDQIQAMGRRIVYEESPMKPSKRSRLWSHEELLEAIEEPEGAQMIEVILPKSLPHRRNFAMMLKLRVLHVAAVQSKGEFPQLPPNLRWLTWKDFIVPANFYHEKLVHMDLSRSQIREAWTNKPQNENQRFQKLKVLNLQYCDVSHESLDFSWFPYLETLDLGGCTNMVNLHKSIGDLKSLVELNLRETEIEELPNSICSLSSLKVLDLNMCSSLKNLPESIGYLKSLVNLNLGCTKIEELPNSICRLSSLKALDLNECLSLKNLPESIGDLKSLVTLNLGYTKIEKLPNSICSLSSLEVLTLQWCSSLKSLPESIGDLKSLVKLDLGGTSIEEIPSSICKLNKAKIKEVPDGVWLLEQLEELTLQYCHNLVKLPISWGRMRCLRIIDLRGTRILLPWDDSAILLPSLVELRIGDNLESSLPSWISGIPQLRHLELEGCTKLESIPDLPSTLTSLTIVDCISLQTLPDMSSLEHLSSLSLFGCKELKEIRGFEGTESLKDLWVINCKTLTNTGRWKIHGQGTLSVDKSQRIDNYSLLNVSDGIDKGLILCVVFDLQNVQDYVEEGELVDISLSISVDICRHKKHGRICCLNEVVIEGVEYTARKRDIIYVHHFKGFDWFGILLEPGFDAIEVLYVVGDIRSSRGKEIRPIECKVKFWKLLLESTASEQQQQQQTSNQEEEESITTTARKMVADFFNWSNRTNPVVPQQADFVNWSNRRGSD